MIATQPSDPIWDDLVDRLALHDVHYLTGGSAWDGKDSNYHSVSEANLGRLIEDLARARHARLQNALVALLFRHPEYANSALTVADVFDETDRARLLIRASILVAASLRAMWSFVLNIYLPGQLSVEAERLALEMGCPDPSVDYGRLCMVAVADQLRRDQPFPFNYERAWEDAARHVLAELRMEARQGA